MGSGLDLLTAATRWIAGTARIFEAEQTRDLVERLAGRIVASCREPFGNAVLAEHDASRYGRR